MAHALKSPYVTLKLTLAQHAKHQVRKFYESRPGFRCLGAIIEGNVTIGSRRESGATYVLDKNRRHWDDYERRGGKFLFAPR